MPSHRISGTRGVVNLSLIVGLVLTVTGVVIVALGKLGIDPWIVAFVGLVFAADIVFYLSAFGLKSLTVGLIVFFVFAVLLTGVLYLDWGGLGILGSHSPGPFGLQSPGTG